MIVRIALLILLLAPARFAAAETYRIDPTGSKIIFVVSHLLGSARGLFHQFNGKVTLDLNEPERSSVTATIQVASIDTQIRRRDEHLMSAEFFDAAKFPTITFRSESVKRTAPDSADIAGELTMKGVTRPITLHAQLRTPITNEMPKRTWWQVTSDPITRKDFGLMFSPTAESISGIGKQVATSMVIEAIKE